MNMREITDAALAALGEGVVVARHSHTLNLRWANSALTTNGDASSTDMTVIATQCDGERYRFGEVAGQVRDVADAQRLAGEARTACERSAAIDGLPLPPGPADGAFDDPPDRLGTDVASQMVAALSSFQASGLAQFGFAESDLTTTYLATSAGTRYRHAQPTFRFEACARDDTGSTWWGTTSPGADFEKAAAEQPRFLAAQSRREGLAPGRHTVILTPSAVADLMIYLAWSADGRDAVEGHNVFSRPGGGTRIGDQLTDRPVTLFADPAYPGLECADRAVVEANNSMDSVFDNGLPLGRQDLIRAGELVALRASRPTAKAIGLQPTYLADNLVLDDASGAGDHEALLQRTDDAILITCLWYIREVDPENLLLTGLTRDGVYRVRDGEIIAAVPNFRFNVSVPEVLANIADSSMTASCLPREWADWFTRAAMPSLRVENFNLSSVSDAL